MTDIGDTYGSDGYGSGVYDSAGEVDECCCDDDSSLTYTEEFYGTAEAASVAEDPVAYEVPQTAVSSASGPGVENPVWPAPAPQTDSAVVGGTDLYGGMTIVDSDSGLVDSSATPSDVAVVGGTDPYGGMTVVEPAGGVVEPSAVSPQVAFVGGTDPYGGMTIVASDGAVVDPSAMGSQVGVVGGSNPYSEASRALTEDAARFAQLSLSEQKAEVFGGTPEMWDGPSISLQGPGESADDILIRGMQTNEALRQLAKSERGLTDVTSPLYKPGDDIDPSSPYYGHRP